MWDAKYADVDLTRLTDFLELQGIRLAGRATGRNRLEWPLGKWAQKHGAGEVTATMPPGATPMTRRCSPMRSRRSIRCRREEGPFNSQLPIGHVPIAGQIAYSLDPDWITIAQRLDGDGEDLRRVHGTDGVGAAIGDSVPRDQPRLAGERSRARRHHDRVRRADRRDRHRRPRRVRRRACYESFSRPRIEGHFVGDRMRAWDTIWGHGVADLVIQNSYVDIKKSVIEQDGSRIDAEGRFSLGFPRKDGGEEINANVRDDRSVRWRICATRSCSTTIRSTA